MSRTYNIIDADGHVLEPPDFWQEYIDPAYRDRAPQLFVDTDGQERLRIEGRVLGGPKGLGFAGAPSAPGRERPQRTLNMSKAARAVLTPMPGS